MGWWYDEDSENKKLKNQLNNAQQQVSNQQNRILSYERKIQEQENLIKQLQMELEVEKRINQRAVKGKQEIINKKADFLSDLNNTLKSI